MNKLSFKIYPYRLQFKQKAQTSRATYLYHNIYYLQLSYAGYRAYGEIAPLEGLSIELSDTYPNFIEAQLRTFCEFMNKPEQLIDFKSFDKFNWENLRGCPSLIFGIETAFYSLIAQIKAKAKTTELIDSQELPIEDIRRSKNLRIWENDFSAGKRDIAINSLIWMGSYEEMYQRIKEKLEHNAKCIKLKIAAINFEDELRLLKFIRKDFSEADLILRLDANGAFKPEEAMEKLQRLSEYKIHSIEQVIRAGQWEEFSKICEKSPIDIALDEELIADYTQRGKVSAYSRERKIKALDSIGAKYLIIKPSLHGGLRFSEEWIELAKERNMGYWITSALESNIGLNAIAQWTDNFNLKIYQGLGTSLLYTNNIDMALQARANELWKIQDAE